MKLVHFSRGPLPELHPVDQMPARFRGMKPCGLWVSDESHPKDGWFSWVSCSMPDWTEQYTHSTRFSLAPDHEVLIIDDHVKFEKFVEEFGAVPEHYQKLASRMNNSAPAEKWLSYPAWGQIAEKYKGLIITPHMREERWNALWYSSWDCASGCIWDVSCLIRGRSKPFKWRNKHVQEEAL